MALNRHCAVCDFQSRCREMAIDRDDLSLLTAATLKERARFGAKGISTITQLSYAYRPRRRKHTNRGGDRSSKSSQRPPQMVKNDHNLKALAIKKSQIHVVGTPSLRFEGTAVFLDVEGMPDRDFYYLAGLQYEHAGEQVEHSFWRIYLKTNAKYGRTACERSRRLATLRSSATARTKIGSSSR